MRTHPENNHELHDLRWRCQHYIDSYDQDLDLGPAISALTGSLDAVDWHDPKPDATPELPEHFKLYDQPPTTGQLNQLVLTVNKIIDYLETR